MPKKPAIQKKSGLDALWGRLHGMRLRPAVAKLLPDSSDTDRLERLGALPEGENTFLWSITEAQDSNRLSLWTAFVNLVPVRMLDNGDIVFVYIDNDSTATPFIVWDHERDVPAWAAGDKLSRLDAIEIDSPPMQPLSAEAEYALEFTRRAAYIVEILARGEFDLNRYLAFDHQPLEKNDDFFKNIQTFPPTALYVLWHAYFSKDEKTLKEAIGYALKSESQLIRDSAALLKKIVSGSARVGNIADISKIREKAAAIITNPDTRKNAQAKELRARVDAQLAQKSGEPRLVKVGAVPAKEGQAPVGVGGVCDLGSGYALGIIETKRPPVTDIVLYAKTAAGALRALSAQRIQDTGMPPTTCFEPAVLPLGGTRFALWRRADAKVAMFPFNGQLSVFDVAHGQIRAVDSFSFDLQDVRGMAGSLIATATDGTLYQLEWKNGEEKSGQAAPPPAFPGTSVSEPKEGQLPSQQAELDGDTLVLTSTSLKAMRGKTLLWEEPLTEAYEMVVLPGRRQVAVYGTDYKHVPQVDVLYVRNITAPVGRGEGCCSWLALPCEGVVVSMRAVGDSLFLGVDGQWTKIDEKALSEPPSWIVARKWL